MATRVSERNVVKELSQLEEHKMYNFKLLLGDEYSEKTINGLIESGVDYHELEDLLKKGCPKALAVSILL